MAKVKTNEEIEIEKIKRGEFTAIALEAKKDGFTSVW